MARGLTEGSSRRCPCLPSDHTKACIGPSSISAKNGRSSETLEKVIRRGYIEYRLVVTTPRFRGPDSESGARTIPRVGAWRHSCVKKNGVNEGIFIRHLTPIWAAARLRDGYSADKQYRVSRRNMSLRHSLKHGSFLVACAWLATLTASCHVGRRESSTLG